MMRQSMIKIFVGLFMMATVLFGYIPQPQYLIELTCISNMLGGVLLLIDGILNRKRKSLPTILHLNVCLCILTVFCVCMGSLLSGAGKFNFSGAFFFLHVINPIVFLACYLFFCNDTDKKKAHVLWAPILMILYLLFDYIRCTFTGSFVYGLAKPEQVTLLYAALIGIGMYLLMCLLAFVLLLFNKQTHKARGRI